MGSTPECVVDKACHTGEGPLWHPEEACLYWLDIPQARLFRHTPASGRTEAFDTKVPVGGVTLHEDGRLLLFMAEGAVRLWRDGTMETVLESLPEERGNRFNDVIADPEGRVFCGVMSTPERAGRLYRLDPDGRIHVVLEGTQTANGMGFSPDLQHFYFCDSGEATLSVFDYNRATGEIANRRVLVRPSPEYGRPDGMTVDAEGCLWSARWGGACVVRHAPDGAVLARIAFPAARNVSCVTFGGSGYDVLYATTAGAQDRASHGELAGALFRMVPGVKGKPEFRSRLTDR